MNPFQTIPVVEKPRSMFEKNKSYKTSFNEGKLIPFFVEEVMPGDTHMVRANLFARLTGSLIRPTMDNMYLETFFFFVPFRILWDNWVKMWGEQDNPNDSTDFLVPEVQAAVGPLATEQDLFDYFGIPTGITGIKMSALYPRAYNKIYNEWFRDQRLIDSAVENTDDGPDDVTDFPLRNRGKRADYFTQSNPWPQKGPDVSLPLGATAPVVGTGAPFLGANATAGFEMHASGSFQPLPGNSGLYLVNSSNYNGPAFWTDPNLEVDLSNATAATINQLREAFVAQQFYEMLARGGSRYTEMLMNVFGVSNGDARLQRPEYLGGGRTNVFINPVFNTAGQQVAGAPNQADLAAYAVASSAPGDGHGFSKSFTEHGCIIGLLCVRADVNYQQGIPRHFSRRTKFDFPIPHFAHLGEQAVLNKEIFAQGTPADDLAFGYIPRYDECRYGINKVTGKLRSAAATSLDYWHLAQDFANLPVLNEEFITEDAPIERIVAVPAEDHFILDSWINHRTVAPLPVSGTPGLRRL